MSSESSLVSTRHRGPIGWATTGFFALLCAAFLFRAFQYGYQWLSGAASAEQNFKVLTIWCLVYVVICGAVAWIAYRLSGSAEESAPGTSE